MNHVGTTIKGGAKPGHKVMQFTLHGRDNQRWSINSDGTITVANTNLALDIQGAEKNPGARVRRCLFHLIFKDNRVG